MSTEKANERINNKASQNGTKKSSKGIIILLCIVVIAILVGVIVFMLLGKDEPETYNQVVTPENVDEVISQLENRAEPGSYVVTMNGDWEFENGDSASTNAYVLNDAMNTNTVYFTIVTEDDNKLIYTSPYLGVGSYIDNIKLDTPLSAGTYNAVITYHLVDDDHNDLSSVSMALTIIIKN